MKLILIVNQGQIVMLDYDGKISSLTFLSIALMLRPPFIL